MTDLVSVEWPSHDSHHIAMLMVQCSGRVKAVTHDGTPLVEVQPVWWRRVFNWLTPWRVRTRVFVRGGTHG